MKSKVEVLMSQVYAKVHDRFVSNYVSTMRGSMIGKERFVLAKHKSSYLIPVTIYIKAMEDISMQTLHFCAYFKQENNLKPAGYLLTFPNGNMIDISSGMLQLLGVTSDDMDADTNIEAWVSWPLKISFLGSWTMWMI